MKLFKRTSTATDSSSGTAPGITADHEASNRYWRTLLILGYIAAVLLFSGLARADQPLLNGVVSIFGF